MPVSPQPSFSWTVSGGGTIDTNGVFTAVTAGGPFVVTATVATSVASAVALSGTASVTVTQPTPPPPVLTKILVTPPTATVPVGDTVPFTAVGVDQTGVPVLPQPSFNWSVSGGGTIDTNGVSTAVTAGRPGVIAATSPGNTTVPSIFGKASLTVVAQTPPPPILTSIVVQPADGRVPVGGTVPFVATAFDQNGAPILPAPAFAWTVGGGGTIDSHGVFTATTVGGPFLVTATAVGWKLR